ncbi:MAG TPA: autotransporter outer membrane beta-barrel domain-containing protein [Burkholderiales bacterium]|nr:autotransporter outer membrane beta-barrel domain-containing protein [Burkholderiales bacterium]
MLSRWIKGWVATGFALAAGSAGAANAPFQDFFFSVCGGATSTLATRCSETTGGLGNLSGDSESSLNPSQALGHNRSLVDAAQARGDLRGAGPVEPGARVDVGPFGLLVNVFGSWFERDAGTTAVAERALDGDSRGAEIGLDYRLSDTAVLGAFGGVERSDYKFTAEDPGTNFTPESRAGDGDVEDVYLTLFSSFGIGESGFVDLSGGYGWTDSTYRRFSVFQESTRTLAQVDTAMAGDTEGTTTWLGLNAGQDFGQGALGFGLYGGITWTRTKLGGYAETDLSGSGLAMEFGSTKRSSTLGHAGLRIAYTGSGNAGVFVPQLRVEYQHQLNGDPQSIDSRFLLDTANTTFSLVGEDQDESGVEAALSISAVLPGGWSTFLDYSMLLSNNDLDRSRLTLGFRKEF